MSDRRVAVVLGTYDRRPLLEAAVESIRRAVGSLRYEIVVVDGGSVDGSREWLAAQLDVVLIGQRGPLTGAVAAFNLGFGYAVDAGFGFVCHFNDDAAFVQHRGVAEIAAAVELLEADGGAGAVAFEFDLRGPYQFERVHGKTYTNFGVIRREAGMAVARASGDPTGRAWWNPLYKTYGADSELGCWLWRLGWRVLDGHDLRVHDGNAQDELRRRNEGNAGGERGDSKLFWSRWASPESIRPPAAAREWAGAKLHLGCGGKRLAGWVNSDGIVGPGVDVILDITRDLHAIPTGSLAQVYWSHGPEHVPADLLPGVLRELRRVLAPSGRLTLAAPDFDAIVAARASGMKPPSWNAALYGEARSTDHPYLAHRQCFTVDSLADALVEAGFGGVAGWQPEQYPEIHALADHATVSRGVTVHLEATGAGVDQRPAVQRPAAGPQTRAVWGTTRELAHVGPARASGDAWPKILTPALGKFPPAVVVSRPNERVVHVALRTDGEKQPGLEAALRSIASRYVEVDWADVTRREGRGMVARHIQHAVRKTRATLVFMQLQQAGVVQPEEIAEWRKAGADNMVVANWDGDQHWHPQDAQRQWFVDLGKVCDTSLVVNTDHPAIYSRLRVRHPGYLQIGTDERWTSPPPGATTAPDVVLLAGRYPDMDAYRHRRDVVEALATWLGPQRFGVFGAGWQDHPCGRPMLKQTEEAHVYRAAKIALSMSITNKIARYTSDRLFRALASGAMTFVERFPDLEGLGLVDDENCVIWDDIDDLRAKIESELTSTGHERRIRRAAAELAGQHHTWAARMAELLAIVGTVRAAGAR